VVAAGIFFLKVVFFALSATKEVIKASTVQPFLKAFVE